MTRKRYLTFPIVLLARYGLRIKEALDAVMDYCLYDNTQRHRDTFSEAAKRMGITFHNMENSIRNGKTLYESIDDRAVKTSISTDMIFDFYKNTKTEFEIVTFIAFAAIRTILQKQTYVRITNEYLLSRMSGNNKIGEVALFLKPFNTRYRLDKIKEELQLKWGLKLYALRCRGYYVSFKLSINELITCVEKDKAFRRLKKQELQQKKISARSAALSAIHEQLGQQSVSSYK